MKKILNKRLGVISAFINHEDKVIDIGCDHGLLGIYLVLEKNISKMISSDINAKPLEKAKENLAKYQVEGNILLKQGNGLEPIEEDIDTVVISGMGGMTIVKILENIKNYPKIKKLIVSPNNEFSLTRKMIMKYGFVIEEEKIVLEQGKYYLVSCYKKGKKKINTFFGKLNIYEKEVKDYYLYIYDKNKKILAQLSFWQKLKKKELIKENLLIRWKMR